MSALIPGTRSFHDPITDKEEVWLDDGIDDKTKKWLRCRIQGPIEQRGEIFLAPAEVQRCVQAIRNSGITKILSLFGRGKSANSLSIPDESGSLSEETAVPEGERMLNMHLAWGDGSLENVPGLKRVSTHGSVHLVELPLEEKIESVREYDSLVEGLKPYGRIVFDYCPEKADQICILMKNFHGKSDSLTKQSLRDPRMGQLFFQQQNAIKNALDEISKRDPGSQVHLYLEGFAAEAEDKSIQNFFNWNNRPPTDYVEEICSGIELDMANALRHFQKMQAAMDNCIDPVKLKYAFAITAGDMRFILSSMEQGQSWIGKVHGMRYDQLDGFDEIMRVGSIDDQKKAVSNDHDQVHKRVVNKIIESSLPGTIHVVVLGGLHFKTGFKLGELQEKFLEPYALEHYFEKTDLVCTTRIIVLEPMAFDQLALLDYQMRVADDLRRS